MGSKHEYENHKTCFGTFLHEKSCRKFNRTNAEISILFLPLKKHVNIKTKLNQFKLENLNTFANKLVEGKVQKTDNISLFNTHQILE